ncbi:MAG TPA: alpha-L-glutamate ligase-like protein [Oligoflexia bacterium]|nr:alpha-L-glutamate ligase-like protein [Oligoflexia bacterium]HMP49845.1 alpha-L-glutamate ligase-like protein [Oligoflexia bacterium]
MIFSALKKAGILGMNRRLGSYILPHNPRKFYPLVDDKVETAALLHSHKIPTPANFLVIESYGELRNLHFELENLSDFVIKPARGSQGNGILVVHEVIKSEDDIKTPSFRSTKGIKSIQDIQYHISSILSGLYSLAGFNDRAIIQEKLSIHPLFERLSPSGIPDIRIIVFKGFPVMAMIRLATEASGGRANLHQGAIGCGIEIATGLLTHAVHRNSSISRHPDTDLPLKGIQIPFWDEALLLASRCFDITGLGYLGVDIVMDPQKGPVLLEMNARPGLSIQTANLSGLVPRLERVEGVLERLSPEDRVVVSKQWF